MSQHIIPIVSNTPPPFDDDDDDDEYDDKFQNFSCDTYDNWKKDDFGDFFGSSLTTNDVKHSQKPSIVPGVKDDLSFHTNNFSEIDLTHGTKENLNELSDDLIKNDLFDSSRNLKHFDTELGVAPNNAVSSKATDSIDASKNFEIVEETKRTSDKLSAHLDLDKKTVDFLNISDKNVSLQSVSKSHCSARKDSNENIVCNVNKHEVAADKDNISFPGDFIPIANENKTVTSETPDKSSSLPVCKQNSMTLDHIEMENIKNSNSSCTFYSNNNISSNESFQSTSELESTQFHSAPETFPYSTKDINFSNNSQNTILNDSGTQFVPVSVVSEIEVQEEFNHADTFSTLTELDKNLESQQYQKENNTVAEEDFADFAAFKPEFPQNNAQNTTNTVTDSSPSTSDNFAKFADANFATFQSSSFASENDDDFGDFGAATVEPSQTTIRSTFSTSEVSNFIKWFRLSECSDISSNESTTSIQSHIEKNCLKLFENCDSSTTLLRPTDVWDLIEDVDNAIALKFQWNSSLAHKQLLKSLGVNTQNMLFSEGNVPYYIPTYYAASLDLLPPCPKSSTSFSSSDSVPADGMPEWNTETEKADQAACSPGNGFGASSSLTSTNQIISVNFNLDLLEESFSKSSKQTFSSSQDEVKIDPDLLELAMDVNIDAPSSIKADPLAKILSSFKLSKKFSDDEEELSEDALDVLKRLPDLSYMRSHVLMFPLSHSVAD